MTHRDLNTIISQWRSTLPHKDWYIRLERDIRRYFLRPPTSEEDRRVRWAIYDLLTEELESGRANLGNDGIDWDSERTDIRFVVIHHSGTDANISISRLSAMGLIRLYAPVYLNANEYPEAYRRPIFSHHFVGRRQVFYAYHWLVRKDGTSERLLDDDKIGWHAGDWGVNCASVGICLAGDYSKTPPSESALQSARDLASRYRNARLLRHRDVNIETDCPGSWASGELWHVLTTSPQA